MKKKPQAKARSLKEIKDYDAADTSNRVNPAKQLKFEDLGLKLPETPPTQVVSIRLPSELLNELKAIGSQRDVPYQALIKLFLSESVAQMKKKSA
jgi:predicted DNA binding CopG/RHH family protein